MQQIMRNKDKTYSACPVLFDADAQAYLQDGSLPDKPHYNEVPPWAIVRNRAFWLKPSYRAHVDAVSFLISTDAYVMNADPLQAVRSQIYCYYSESSATHYLGRINEADAKQGAEKVLIPLIEGLHEPLKLADLKYVGRVIAAN